MSLQPCPECLGTGLTLNREFRPCCCWYCSGTRTRFVGEPDPPRLKIAESRDGLSYLDQWSRDVRRATRERGCG